METSFLALHVDFITAILMALLGFGAFIPAVYWSMTCYYNYDKKAWRIAGAAVAYALTAACLIPVFVLRSDGLNATGAFTNQIAERYGIESRNNTDAIKQALASDATEIMTELPNTEHVVTYNNGQLIATDERFAIRVTKTFKGELPVKEVTAKIEMFHAIGDGEETVFIPIDEDNSNTTPPAASYEPTDALEE